MRYVAPSKRPGRKQTSADQIHRLVRMEEARQKQIQRPFDPEAERESYAQPHHFAVNSGPTPYVLKQITEDGTLWVSEQFNAATGRHVAQAVIAGALFGQPRWAEAPDGTFLYGLDAKGKEMPRAPGQHARNAHELHFGGYDFTSGPEGTRIHRERVRTDLPGDYGADPLGDGTFRMVPSGDVVDYEERGRRLSGRSHAPNAGPRGTLDEHAATELVLFIENTADLSPDGPSGQGRSVLLNALRKWKKGTYDSEMAVKLFEYLTESGARRYVQENHSSMPWNQMFNVPTRHEAASQLEASFRASAEQGEYDRVDTSLGR